MNGRQYNNRCDDAQRSDFKKILNSRKVYLVSRINQAKILSRRYGFYDNVNFETLDRLDIVISQIHEQQK
ncbi:hypothetical protein KIN20_028160 [Parelaphostrongylus tenuis]|uniref:Uncharacterized protein n=1 Tax=Parelaphostrongylus tenuis TaxID=148309 RepID=A0AAD5WEG8_PARTN|nr:hypothetical protein KIN20_028160 [Parelaphostrongylus tenuis]